jgi:hypothetical protein
MRAEREERARNEDRGEAVRARLHRDRVDAYREFTAAYGEYSAIHSKLVADWANRNRCAGELDSSNERVNAFDAANATFLGTAEAAVAAGTQLQDTLSMLELVASAPVATAATALTEQADIASKAAMRAGDKPHDGLTPEEWTAIQKASATVEVARGVLRDAIRSELQQGS